MISRRSLVMLSALAAAAPALAQEAGSADPALARIKGFYASIESMMRAHAAAPDRPKMMAALTQAVGETFDLTAMLRTAVGPQWSKIPADKQATLQDAFSRYFVAAYAGRLGSATGGSFEVNPQVDKRSNGRLVRSVITDERGIKTGVDFLVNAENKVVDVYLDGSVSEMASRRTDFDGFLKKGGADALVAELNRRADQAPK